MFSISIDEKYVRVVHSGTVCFNERRAALTGAIWINHQQVENLKPYIVDLRRCAIPHEPPSTSAGFSKDLSYYSPGAPIAYLVDILNGPNFFVVQQLSRCGVKAKNFANEALAHIWFDHAIK